MWPFFAIFVILLVALAWLTRARAEAFVDMEAAAEQMKTPKDLFKYAREMLEKYDRPEIWNHAAQVMDKDPSQLARMHLNINN